MHSPVSVVHFEKEGKSCEKIGGSHADVRAADGALLRDGKRQRGLLHVYLPGALGGGTWRFQGQQDLGRPDPRLLCHTGRL
ncbi:hypothetical protein SDC9_206044 [bioreactor metagenome]|uniref:Uncharacterized protein n=1 Tax=bioreactor metagenome TaxID=1076179 RepID=A0A645J5C8_9ZZZZ